MPPTPGNPRDHGVGVQVGPKPSLSTFFGPGVHIQSSQIVESSGLYTLESVLKAQLAKEDKDAQFYCELNYRLPSGNHMKESQEVTVQVFCESCDGPGLSWWQLAPLPGVGTARGLRTTPSVPLQTRRRRCGWKWSPREC